MSEEIITGFIDRELIKGDRDILVGSIEDANEAYVKLYNLTKESKIRLQGATGLKEVTTAADEGVKANARLSESTKAVIAVVRDRFAAEAKYQTLQVQNGKATNDYTRETIKQKAVIADLTKEMKLQAAVDLASSGSIQKATALRAKMYFEQTRLNLATKEGAARSEVLKGRIDSLSSFIKKNSDALTQQKINIGNYSGAINILKGSFDEVGKKIDDLTKAGKKNTEEFRNLKKEYDLLEKLVDSQAAGFANATMEVRANTKALLDLENAGLQGTAAFQELAQRTGDLKDQVADLRQRTKTLGSDTFVFDGLIGAATGLAGAYGAAQGAVALFGDENEELQKQMVKLQAVMAVIQGLQAVQNTLQKEGAAVLLLSQVRTAGLAAAQKLYAFFTAGATVATKAWGFALKATGIGIVLTLIVAAASAMSDLGKKTKVTGDETDAFADRLNKLSDELEGVTKLIDKQAESQRALNRLKFAGEALEAADAQTNKNAILDKRADIINRIAQAEAERARMIAERARVEAIADKAIDRDAFTDSFKTIETNIGAADKKIADLNAKLVEEGGNLTKLRLQESGDAAQEAFKKADDLAKKSLEAEKKRLQDAAQAKLDIETRNARALDDLLKGNALRRIREAEELANNEENQIGVRLNAEKEALAFRKGIAAQEYAEAIADTKKIEDGKLVISKKTKTEKAAIEQAYNDKVAELESASGKRISEIKKQQSEKDRAQVQADQELELQLIRETTDKRQAELEKQYNDDLTVLNGRFASGKISQNKFNEEKLKLDEAYHRDALVAEIEFTKQVLAVMALRGVDVSKQLADLAKLERELSEMTANKVISDEERKKKAREESNAKLVSDLEKIQSAYGVLNDIVSGAVNAAATSQKNKIQSQIDDIDKRKDAELKANEVLQISEEKKAANVILINARAQAQKEELDRRSKLIDQQKARADKMLSIFQITLATAVNVAKAANPFMKVLAAIQGAAQLAIAIATPIPKFKTGLFHDYEGPGMINDGPKNEVLIKADGKVEFPTGRNIIRQFKVGERVLPDAEAFKRSVNQTALRHSGMFTAPTVTDNSDVIAKAIAGQSHLLTKIANKKDFRLENSEQGMVAILKHGAAQIKYVNDQTNWNG